MAAVSKVLVIGGGFSGMAAAIQMRKAGIDVDLVEIDPNWRPEGAGITVNGASLRALRDDRRLRRDRKARLCLERRRASCAPTARRSARFRRLRSAGSDVAGGGGIMRTDLGRILADATRKSRRQRPHWRHLRAPRRQGRRRSRSPSATECAQPTISSSAPTACARSCANGCSPRSRRRNTSARSSGARCCRGHEEIVRPRMWMGGASQGRRQPGLGDAHVHVRHRGARRAEPARPVDLARSRSPRC